MNKQEIKKIINLFADKTGCSSQFNGCPCNTCFHSIEGVDFQHLCWMLILGLRGDYEFKEIYEGIKEGLN